MNEQQREETGALGSAQAVVKPKKSISIENYDALVEAQSRAIAALSRTIVDEIVKVSNRN